MNSKLNAQITVMASCIIVLVLSLVVTCIKSVSDSITRTHMNIACNLSVESLFAGYSKPLLEEFQVLYLENSEELNSVLNKYISENINSTGGFNNINLQSSEILDMTMAVGSGMPTIKEEVIKYMKYGILNNIKDAFIDSEEVIKKFQKTEEVVSQMSGCEEYTAKADRDMLRFIKVVEGLETDEHGFKTNHNNPVASTEKFAKQLIVGNPEPDRVLVYQDQVYKAMREEYIDVSNIFEDISISCNEMIGYAGENGESYYREIDACGRTYENNISKLKDLISDVKKQYITALEINENYKQNVDDAMLYINDCKTNIDKGKNVIGEELTKNFVQDLNEFTDNNGESQYRICNVPEAAHAIEENMEILDGCYSILQEMDKGLYIANAEEMKQNTLNCEYLLSKLDYSKIIFNYSKVNFAQGPGIETIRNLKQSISSGLMDLIIDNPDNISSKKLNISNLASSLSTLSKEDNLNWDKFVEDSKDNMLFNEYILKQFNTYRDNFNDRNEYVNNEKLIDYSAEYILNNKDNDRDNLKETALKLVVFRSGANLSYLFTDNEKKEQCYALSAALVGFSGIPSIIRVGQYFIMALWAFAEAVSDVRNLFNGQRIRLIKNKDNWKLSLENLLDMDLKNNAQETEMKNDVESSDGLTYEDYIKILFYMEKPYSKYFRTMDCMEMRMIEKGYQNFRFKDYVYSISASAVFSINKSANIIRCDMQYSY